MWGKKFPRKDWLECIFLKKWLHAPTQSLKMVFQDYCDWRNYLQDRQFKKDCQTAVTAVLDLSREEVNHFMKNMFWLLLLMKAAPILEIFLTKSGSANLTWMFSNCSDCCLRITKSKGGDCELQLIEVRKSDLEMTFDIVCRRWEMGTFRWQISLTRIVLSTVGDWIYKYCIKYLHSVILRLQDVRLDIKGSDCRSNQGRSGSVHGEIFVLRNCTIAYIKFWCRWSGNSRMHFERMTRDWKPEKEWTILWK